MSVGRATSLLFMISVIRSRGLKTPMTSQPHITLNPVIDKEEEVRVRPRVNDMEDLPAHGDADARGEYWYDYKRSSEKRENIDHKDFSGSFSSLQTSKESDRYDCKHNTYEKGSSSETNEKKLEKRFYRQCVPCPHDMLKKYTNVGIKWICGAYQRARRSFKSECMMRYRNCQDGTMFVKISSHRCVADPYHGRHFFYLYGV